MTARPPRDSLKKLTRCGFVLQLAKDENVAGLAHCVLEKQAPADAAVADQNLGGMCGQGDLRKDAGARQDDVSALGIETGHLLAFGLRRYTKAGDLPFQCRQR